MQNRKNLLITGLIFLAVTLSCKSFMPAKSTGTSQGPAVDFTKPGSPLDVKVQLDKKQTSSGKISPAGGSLSLTSADGSKFTLDVPANALKAETTITMTAVSNIDGAPLDTKTPVAVQLEPSGLIFKEMATLTIVPAKEIPVKNQIIFGYEGSGKDYHLAVIDPKSKDIKIKLMHFSGAGVGSGSDADWAATLMVQAGAAETRLNQKLGETLQELRRRMILGDEDSAETNELTEQAKSALDQFEDQVVLKEIAAAELDCKHAQKALDDLLYLERLRQLLAFPPGSGSAEKALRLGEIGKKCKKSYRVNGSSGGASFEGEICSLDKPFVLNVDSITGSWPMNFTPDTETSGQMEGTYSGGGCTQSGGGPYTVTLNEDGSGTIQFTFNATATCPTGTHTSSATSKLPLTPASEVSCS
ncbi:MAG: hypothetical protein H7070_02390 [Saprospiraceae bacterium]|nr:hypothetical protein [Pyrinomonadaceae bacterium]